MRDMAKTSVVDTNVVLRWLLQDHATLSPAANAFWTRVREGQQTALLLDIVIAEVAFVLNRSYGVPKAEVAEQLGRLVTMRHLRFQNRDALVDAIGLYTRKNISLVDALVVAHARTGGNAIMSFDADLNKAASKPAVAHR